MTGARDDHEARISALEAHRTDTKSLVAAINALGENQRDHSLRITRVEDRLDSVEDRLGRVETKLDRFATDTTLRFNALEENHAELRDLILRALDR